MTALAAIFARESSSSFRKLAARGHNLSLERATEPAVTLTRHQSKSNPAAPASAPKVHVVTFGCQMNKYDSLLAEGRFKRRGWVTTEAIDDADVVLFNTCSVREHAEERTFSWLGELKRAKQHNPALVVGVMGCMAQRIGAEIFARAGHVDLIAGTRQFANLPALVDEVRERRARGLSAREARVVALGMDDTVLVDREDEPFDGGLHAYLTVMRGCDLNCTYCIVPTVRGRVLSYPLEHVVREARGFVERGARVITLLGQTVNSWGEDFTPPADGEARGRGRQGRRSLADLLYALQDVDGLERIRLITLHPSYATDALGEAIAACDKVDRFLPMPAQSGSDPILRAMRRGYTSDLYRRRVDILRTRVPDLELGSDWIVGFPRESDGDHRQSEALLDEIGFAVNYVFKYDPRPTTHAAEKLADDVADATKKARNQLLLAKAEEVGLKRHGAHVGNVRRAFLESASDRDDGAAIGRTVHGLAISVRGGSQRIGTTVDVRVEGASAYGLSGSLAG